MFGNGLISALCFRNSGTKGALLCIGDRWDQRPARARNAIRHIDLKYLINRIESEHAALKQRLRPMWGFQTLAEAKSALAGIETFRTIGKGQFENCETGVNNEIAFIANLFPVAA